MNPVFDITVVVTRYGETDELVRQCLDSLRRQRGARILVLFLDQKNSEDIKQYCMRSSVPLVTLRYVNIPAKSLSFARNLGMKDAPSGHVVFSDADCILEENWAKEILDTFRSTGAAIVGTKIIPLWQSPTSWYHRSRIIQEFYSLIDISNDRIEVNKAIGASFAVDKMKLGGKIWFDEDLDRQNGSLLSGGDTEFCKKARDAGGRIFYTPFTWANHVVGKERINLGWILKRSYFGGLSRALRKGKIEPFNTKRNLIDYIAVLMILPSYLLGYLRGKTS